MRRDLNIGWFGYSVIGFLTIAAVIALVRAVLMTFIHSTTEDWILIGGTLLGISIVSILSYWVGRGIVYLLSFLD